MTKDDARAWRAAGLEAIRRGKPGHAVRAFERAIAVGGDPAMLGVLRARAMWATGERGRALGDLRSIGRESHTDARVEAARELSFLGALPEALTIAASVLDAVPNHRAALEISFEAARLGWSHEAADAIARAIAIAPRDPGLHVRAATFFEGLREHERAAAHAQSALDASPDLADAWMMLSRCAAAVGQHEASIRAATRAEALVAHQSSRVREIALVRLSAGDWEGAEQALRRALERSPNDLDTLAWLAELALHRLALDEAEGRALAVLEGSSDHPRALAVRGGARVMRGEVERALPDLERAAAAGDATAQHWLGDALRRLGRFDDAVAALDLAIVRSARYAATAHGNRLLALIEQRQEVSGLMSPDAYAELVVTLAPLAGEPGLDVREGQPPAVARHLRAALDALGGNRSDLPTRLEGRRPVSVAIRPNSRTAARYQQERLRIRPVDEVLTGFDALFEQYGELPTLHCHRGEVLVWLGRYEEATASFDRALTIDRGTRWAWIGLGASRMMAGDLAAADRAFRDAVVFAPPTGRTIHVYRGELSLLQGEMDAAQRDLERSLELNPERLSGSLLLALVLSATGRAPLAHARIERARLAAPGLFHDVAAAGADAAPEPSARAALAMMRGNRSAGFVTYFTADGQLRFVPTVSAAALAP